MSSLKHGTGPRHTGAKTNSQEAQFDDLIRYRTDHPGLLDHRTRAIDRLAGAGYPVPALISRSSMIGG